MRFADALIVDLQSGTEIKLAIADMIADEKESIAVCLGSVQQQGSNTKIIPVEVIPGNTACVFRDVDSVMADPRFLLWCIKRAAAGGFSFVLIHTHPRAYHSVTPSPGDIRAARSILSVANRRIPDRPHIFAVIGQKNAFGVVLKLDQLVPVEVRI